MGLTEYFAFLFHVGAVKHLQNTISERLPCVRRQIAGIQLHEQLHGLMTMPATGPGFVRPEQRQATKLGARTGHSRPHPGPPGGPGQGSKLEFDFFGQHETSSLGRFSLPRLSCQSNEHPSQICHQGCFAD